ncbi:hypothetical protein G6O69_21010 [Pseudenhygromyxa sp. WMMC2535]|uniref:hypothetical protein n=1 Tax=Pseudenhygromyxa sp. WMMC2535 TaxID=2712867 RepID=UPI0015531B99|nr:hypothetical protein [Pseudenhygromyxa sp. WMMC2535]NVB40334.1 hypothetical protein [Pseudenhygromyxa sp. WMMC2535]
MSQFIDPGVATMKLEAVLQKVTKPLFELDQELGPSAPPEVLSQEEIDALHPGQPPVLGESSPHYTDVLDQIWMEFDDDEERTAARLFVVVEKVADEALRLHHLQIAFWGRTPEHQVPTKEFTRFQAEYLDYLRRLKKYKDVLLGLPDDSTDTDEVYLGLIKRRTAAGPVPDVIMHLYFLNQLGILEDHAEEMGTGFVGRSMSALEALDDTVDGAVEQVDDAVDAITEDTQQTRRRRLWMFGGFTALTVGGVVTAALLSRDDDPDPRRIP